MKGLPGYEELFGVAFASMVFGELAFLTEWALEEWCCRWEFWDAIDNLLCFVKGRG